MSIVPKGLLLLLLFAFEMNRIAGAGWTGYGMWRAMGWAPRDRNVLRGRI